MIHCFIVYGIHIYTLFSTFPCFSMTFTLHCSPPVWFPNLYVTTVLDSVSTRTVVLTPMNCVLWLMPRMVEHRDLGWSRTVQQAQTIWYQLWLLCCPESIRLLQWYLVPSNGFAPTGNRGGKTTCLRPDSCHEGCAWPPSEHFVEPSGY